MLRNELKRINQRPFDLQMKRFSQYINEKGKVENLPKEEEELQREMTELQSKIDHLINSVCYI